MAPLARRSSTRPRAQSAIRYELRGAVHRARIHLALPGHRPAGFRASRDRLCAGPMAAGIEIPETLCRELPQSRRVRSEEHTSELQSRQYLVCRLLLEKKKIAQTEHHAI